VRRRAPRPGRRTASSAAIWSPADAPGHLAPDLRFERATIAALCQEALSVSEVAARTGLPLGVTRVLVGDMCAEGLLEVTGPVGFAARPGAALLESVLDGLRGG